MKLQFFLYVIILGLVVNLLANMIWKYLPGTDHRIDKIVTAILVSICIILLIFYKENSGVSEGKSTKKIIHEEIIKLHRGELYRFTFYHNATLMIISFHELQEITVEFNIDGIRQEESLKVNRGRSFSITEKEYHFLVTKISHVSSEPLAEFSLIIKGEM